MKKRQQCITMNNNTQQRGQTKNKVQSKTTKKKEIKAYTNNENIKHAKH